MKKYSFSLPQDPEDLFPVDLLEDQVHYKCYIYPPLASPLAYQERLVDLNIDISNMVKGYIWQKQHLDLKLCQHSINNDATIPNGSKPMNELKNKAYYFQGSTCFGDAIDDEWFILYILFEISKKYHNLLISIYDQDGEFMLIEAANELPAWLEPELSPHRTWIQAGCIHIISPSIISTFPKDGFMADTIAIKSIMKSGKTKANQKIQQCIQQRLSFGPSHIELTSQHWATCYLPIPIAYMLKRNPEWIALAINAFYERDPIQLKRIERKPMFITSQKITCSVRFTHCLYAQIAGQEWHPPKRYGTFQDGSNSKSNNQLSFELGAKIACGFEILYQEEDQLSQISTKERGGRKWILDQIDQILESKAFQTCKVEDEFPESELKPSSSLEWLNICPDDFDQMLNKRFLKLDQDSVVNMPSGEGQERKKDSRENHPIEGDKGDFVQKIEQMTKELQQFLNTSSGWEGIEPLEPLHGDNDLYMEDYLDDDEDEDEDIDYFTPTLSASPFSRTLDQVMRRELGESNIGDGFNELIHRNGNKLNDQEGKQIEEGCPNGNHSDKNGSEDDSVEGLDEAFNLMQNFHSSYTGQYGGPGPVTSLIHPITDTKD